jgi:hypothetical protein
LLTFAAAAPTSRGGPVPSARATFERDVKPILAKYCSDCHADGADKGNVAFDAFPTEDALIQDSTLWFKVLKNVRAGMMPPAKKPQPTAEQRELLDRWIKYQAFGIDSANPDPGRVTLRRLNRAEYRNTIRDLMGVDFKAEEEFPPDDTGFGFDNIGDALSTSPLLLEKYMQAAQTVVAQAVPVTSRLVRETVIPGAAFRPPGEQGKDDDRNVPGPARPGSAPRESRAVSFYTPAKLAHTFRVDKAGTYTVAVNLVVRGSFDFDPGRAKVVVKVDDQELVAQDFAWQNGKPFEFTSEHKWQRGDRKFTFELTPLAKPADQKAPARTNADEKTSVDMRIASVIVRGPTERESWDRPKNWDRFFTHDAPADDAARRAYARDVLARFATKAFRRPADAKTIDRLVSIAETAYKLPDRSFEQGVGQAMIAVLASPRFLFRIEQTAPSQPAAAAAAAAATHAPIDEYALASRLSYFLWSTMPDDELLGLAAAGQLRQNLPAQVKRLLADRRADNFVSNFTGQWLQTRDIDGISIDARTVLARDAGIDKELESISRQFRELRAKREEETRKQIAAGEPVRDRQPSPEEEQLRAKFRQFRRGPAVELDGQLRSAMRRETEMYFEHVLREDRPVLDLLDSDYTFVNERLAKHYGIPDVKGEQMRRVTLPPNSPRGGLLTQGAVLVVTSNPTRTSPVKRGLFVLDNILGTPTPPPPPNVGELEEVEKEFKDKEPSLREVLELHRSKPLCSSCHSRMDPLGLALENFNAMGMFRESERKMPIDTAGELSTGEKFTNVRDLKKILTAPERRVDFYRCLTEKMMTYALGRGVEYYDVEAIDQIVRKLESSDGRISALVTGIIDSAPFQKRRTQNTTAAAAN